MIRLSKAFFKEEEAMLFCNRVKLLWNKPVAENWFWLGFQALEKAGMTYYETETEEMKVRERISLLIIFYYEFCHISIMHESENFNYWDENFIMELKADMSEDVDETLFEIKNTLISYFGGELETLAELWVNCLEGNYNCYLKLNEKNRIYELVTSGEYNDINFDRAKTWLIGWNVDINSFESMLL